VVAHTETKRLRLYFAAAKLPRPFVIGGKITLSDTGTALDKEFSILGVGEDTGADAPYLVLAGDYATAAQRLDAVATFTFDLQPYSTYEATVAWAGLPAGCYYVLLTGSHPQTLPVSARSEPVELAPHPDTVRLQWRNFDNAFGLNYTQGLQHLARVRARFQPWVPETESEELVESTGRTVLLSGQARRVYHLKLFGLPQYLHETLALALLHDLVQVDGLEVVRLGEYEPVPSETYGLWNATVQLVQKDWHGAGNGDDLGDINAGDGGFLIANGGFLKL
jgi:hypothetical protein